ncbi:hypothetical protein, partial [Escherichia coli]|uniref:hypothetical protein n=1 Tax=Escherichia coli TaxID=562 RepID=UPI0021B221DF
MSIKNDGHYFCRAGGNRPDGLNEPVTDKLTDIRFLFGNPMLGTWMLCTTNMTVNNISGTIWG